MRVFLFDYREGVAFARAIRDGGGRNMKNLNQRTALFAKLALVLLAAVALFGCAKSDLKDARALASLGKKSSDNLAEFYGLLAKEARDSAQLAQVPPNVENQAVTDNGEALAKALLVRKSIAKKMSDVYAALGGLVDEKTPAEAEAAAKDLLDQLKKLRDPVLPKIGGVDPIPIVQQGFNALTTLVQQREFRKQAPRVLALLDNLRDLFAREKVAYEDIANSYERELRNAIQGRIDKGQVVLTTPLNDYFSVYSLSLDRVVADPELKAWLRRKVDTQWKQREIAAAELVDAEEKMLGTLAKASRDFVEHKEGKQESQNALRSATADSIALMTNFLMKEEVKR